MARRLSWEPDHLALAAVARSPEIIAELEDIRDRAAAETERIAPHGATGDYSRSIVRGPVEIRGDEVSTSYGSKDFAAHIVEFGSVNNPPYRPLHRAAAALGLKVEDA